jgi:hypothetical protein
MNRFLTALACVCLALPLAAQTASTTISPDTITTVMTDAAGNSYKATTPYSISIAPGSTSLVFTPVVVTPPPASGAPAIPSTAKSVNLITQTNWKPCEHDAGTPGTGTCSNNYPVTWITDKAARSFAMTYTGAGGVRWADTIANDAVSTNFVLDTEVSSPDWSHNQVKANGKTAILGTQCSSYSKTWEITLLNSKGGWHWVPVDAPCNPTTWTANVLHHIRIFGSITAAGISTYLGVELDGTYSAFSGATGQTEDALGWGAGTVLTNFQIDGLGASGSAVIYADALTVFRW